MLIVFNVALCLHGICLCCCSCFMYRFFFYLRPSMHGRWQDGSVWKGIWLGMLSITSPTQRRPNSDYRTMKITSVLAVLDILFSQIVVLQHTMREMWHHLYLFAPFYIRSDAFFVRFRLLLFIRFHIVTSLFHLISFHWPSFAHAAIVIHTKMLLSQILFRREKDR